MTNQEFIMLRTKLNEMCEATMKTKGDAYAGKTDRLANFKKNAERVGLSPLHVWAIYFNKHIDAIMSYVAGVAESPEGVETNFMDARNYIDLGYALVAEREANTNGSNNQ